ncbi:glycoside hydrolase family 6 protein [Endozoicomonas ascidiicola]|uniref:glycoside hydrolase family 6 protein n=1 Tax=Endozoicomonas ascidiicola TaxID=1698521 RepID=UPI000833E9BA|nr:glycoside hydrolase family 6 protein [Endozoicomonas ascidiicola]
MKNTLSAKGAALALLFSCMPEIASADCSYQIANEWNTGFVGTIAITNAKAEPINGWNVNWQYADGSVITSHWNATVSGTGTYNASNLGWNGSIAPGQTVSFGVQGNKGSANSPAKIPEINGDHCGLGVDNQAPVASFTLAQNNSEVVFNAADSSDPDGDELTYTWDFGDNTQAQGISPEHNYAQTGQYTVTLIVHEGELSHTFNQVVTVDTLTVNTPPVASIDVYMNGYSVTLDAARSSDAENDTLSFSWDLGDGNTAQDSLVRHDYTSAGQFTVSLVVSDGKNTSSITRQVVITAPSEIAHVNNPFLGATAYINPDYANLVDRSIAQETNPTLKAKMEKMRDVPTAVWLDRIEAIYGGANNSNRLSLEQHFEQALLQKEHGVPMTVTIVVYNLPDRDCAALASNGTLHSKQDGLNIYKRDYIDVIADIAGDARFKDLRIVAVLEPDSLPNLVTNTTVLKCGQVKSDGTYVKGIQHAIGAFAELDNVYTYLDIAHSGWLGWESNLRGAISLYTDVVRGAAGGDMSVLDGFISNVSNYTPTEEIYLDDPEFDFDGNYMGVMSSSYYEWNPVFDEKDFAEQLHSAFVANGFPQDVAMLIDTSRNGWGGSNRPASANEDAASEDQYVIDSKLDRRAHRGNWCNVSGAGIGERPKVLPFGTDSVVEAYVWIKPPGESDGTSDSTQTTPDDEGKSFDHMCSPSYTTSGGVLTGAMDNAPSAGAWFHEQFRMLVKNAYPAL